MKTFTFKKLPNCLLSVLLATVLCCPAMAQDYTTGTEETVDIVFHMPICRNGEPASSAKLYILKDGDMDLPQNYTPVKLVDGGYIDGKQQYNGHYAVSRKAGTKLRYMYADICYENGNNDGNQQRYPYFPHLDSLIVSNKAQEVHIDYREAQEVNLRFKDRDGDEMWLADETGMTLYYNIYFRSDQLSTMQTGYSEGYRNWQKDEKKNVYTHFRLYAFPGKHLLYFMTSPDSKWTCEKGEKDYTPLKNMVVNGYGALECDIDVTGQGGDVYIDFSKWNSSRLRYKNAQHVPGMIPDSYNIRFYSTTLSRHQMAYGTFSEARMTGDRKLDGKDYIVEFLVRESFSDMTLNGELKMTPGQSPEIVIGDYSDVRNVDIELPGMLDGKALFIDNMIACRLSDNGLQGPIMYHTRLKLGEHKVVIADINDDEGSYGHPLNSDSLFTVTEDYATQVVRLEEEDFKRVLYTVYGIDGEQIKQETHFLPAGTDEFHYQEEIYDADVYLFPISGCAKAGPGLTEVNCNFKEQNYLCLTQEPRTLTNNRYLTNNDTVAFAMAHDTFRKIYAPQGTRFLFDIEQTRSTNSKGPSGYKDMMFTLEKDTVFDFSTSRSALVTYMYDGEEITEPSAIETYALDWGGCAVSEHFYRRKMCSLYPGLYKAVYNNEAPVYFSVEAKSQLEIDFAFPPEPPAGINLTQGRTALAIIPQSGGVSLSAADPTALRICNTAGLSVYQGTVIGKFFLNLPAGLYIANGQKFIVK